MENEYFLESIFFLDERGRRYRETMMIWFFRRAISFEMTRDKKILKIW